MNRLLGRWLAPVLVLTLAGGAVADFDANPQNPANWEVLVTEFDGTETAIRKKLVNGQPQTTTWTRDWGYGEQWKCDGVVTPQFYLPFTQLITSTDNISWTTSGTVTVGRRWISPKPAPEQVRCFVFSSASWHARNTPQGACNNGFETSAHPNGGVDESGMFGKRLLSTRILVLPVADGVVKYELQQSASASDTGPTGLLYDPAAVHVEAGIAGLEIDARFAEIQHPNGLPSNRHETGINIIKERTRTYWTVPSDSAPYWTDEVLTFTYPVAIQKPIDQQWTSNSNSLTYHYAVPVIDQEKRITEENNGQGWGYQMVTTWYPSEVIPDVTTDFGAYASTQQKTTEYYKWSGPEGVVEGNMPYLLHWQSPYYLTKHRPHIYFQYNDYYSSTPVHRVDWFDGSHNGFNLSFTYRWDDGTEYVSNRSIFLHKPVEKVVVEPQQYTTWPKLFEPLDFRDYGEWAPKGVVLTFIHVPPKFDVWDLLATVAWISAGLADSVPSNPAALAFGRMGFICAALEKVFRWDSPEPVQEQIGKEIMGNIKVFQRPFNGSDQVRYGSPFADTQIQEYKWKAETAPKVTYTAQATDVWSMSGFVERQYGEDGDEALPLDGLRKMIYYYDGTGNGNGNGSGSGSPD